MCTNHPSADSTDRRAKNAQRSTFASQVAHLDGSSGVCHAYCLMNNHFHLMIETPQANLSRGLR